MFGLFPLSHAGKVEAKILAALQEKNPCTKSEIHQKISGRVSADMLNRILNGLIYLERVNTFESNGKAWVKLGDHFKPKV